MVYFSNLIVNQVLKSNENQIVVIFFFCASKASNVFTIVAVVMQETAR